MKFTILSTELLKGISKVSKALPSKTTEMILENCLVTITDTGLNIEGTDKFITIDAVVPLVSVEETGSIVIPVKQLQALLKDMPEQHLTFATIGDSQFECSWSNGSTTMPYYPAMDFPIAPKLDENVFRVSMPSAVLMDAISSTLYAASNDENRPVITSVLVDIDATHTSFVATDLQCLVCRIVPEIKAESPCSFILNKKHASIIKSLMGKEETLINVAFNNKHARMSLGEDVYVTCALFDGKYPNYKAIIPNANSNVVSVERVALLNVVKRISVCAPKASSHIRFSVVGNSIEVSSQDLGFGVSAKEKIVCEHQGEDITIGFKFTSVLDILSNMDGEKILFKFNSPKTSALVCPEWDSPDVPDNRQFGLIMPVLTR